MQILRAMGYWLLALVVIANAGMPLAASAMDHSKHAAAESIAAIASDALPCHGEPSSQAPAQPDPAPMDCCDDAACLCSCLHHAPMLLLGEACLLMPQHGWVAQLGRLMSLPASPAAPAIRPPIA